MPRPPTFLPAPVGYAGTGAKARRGPAKKIDFFRVVKIETAAPPFGRLAATTGQYFVSDACRFEAEALAMRIRTLPTGVTITQIIRDRANRLRYYFFNALRQSGQNSSPESILTNCSWGESFLPQMSQLPLFPETA